MGIPESPHAQMDGGLVESEGGKKWVIAGIQFRSPLKPIFTANTTPVVKKLRKDDQEDDDDDNDDDTVVVVVEEEEEEEEECSSTTPRAEESRIPSILRCPPAPRKRKPTSRCYFSGVREFFTPPDLESVFIRLA